MTHLLASVVLALQLEPGQPLPPPDTVPEAPAETSPADDLPARKSTGNEDVAEDGGMGLSFRTLTQFRYAQPWISAASLSQPGTPNVYGDTVLTESNAAAYANAERSVASEPGGYRINRAFLRILGKPTESIDAKMLIDFAELARKNPKRALKGLHIELKASKRIVLSAGRFKRTFSLLELLPTAQYELADSGPTDALIHDLGFSGRDNGVMVQVRPLPKKKRLTLWLAGFAGDVVEGSDANPAKLITARAESELTKYLRLGADVAWRPWTTERYNEEEFATGPAGEAKPELDKGWAVSADVTYHTDALELRAEGLLGTRTDLDDPFYPLQLRRGDARKFQAAWLVAAYRFRLGAYALMPAARIEWLDGDRARGKGGLIYASAALNFEIAANVRLLLDLSVQDAQPLSRGYSNVPYLKDKETFYPYLVDFALLTVQLQLLL